MTSSEITDRAIRAHIEAAKVTLEAVVGMGKQFTPMIVAGRGGVPIAYITPPTGDGQMLFRIGQLAADGYVADEIVLLTDTYAATEVLNPYTFKPWRRGEMEDLALNHNGVQRGWVRDALMVLFVRRAGQPEMYTLPYSVTQGSGAVLWLDDEVVCKAAAGPLTRLFEPSGVFDEGEERPGDEVFGRFLEELGATVLR